MKRGSDHQEEGPHQDRWLVSYADFITLMFAFFAVLYATSQRDIEKTKEIQDSMKRFLIKAGAFGETGQQINVGKKEDTVIAPPIETFNNAKPETVQTLDKTEAFIEGQLSRAERDKYLLDVSADQWGVRIALRSSVLFAANSEKFREDALPFINKFSALLPAINREVMIEGHVTPEENGGMKSTWDFSSARAVNVLRFLQKKHGIKGDRMSAVSFGDSRPTYQGGNNSRVEIVLLNTDMQL